MITVLVAGANGQLGKCLQDSVKSYLDLVSIKWDFKNSKELDITNEETINRIIKKNKYNYIINCAAYTNVEQAEKTPELAIAVNSDGVKSLADICKIENITLIHISTDYVFDGEKTEPYKVNDKTNPINEYGKSKLLGEQHIQNRLKKFFIIRTSWLYSKKYGKNFYRTILTKAQTEDKLKITSKETGCPTNANDLANYIISLIIHKKESYGIHHFCGNIVMSWYDFGLEIIEMNNIQDIEILDQEYATVAKRPKYSVLGENKKIL